MMKRILAITTVLSVAAAGLAGGTTRGAKAMFIDTTTGSTIATSAPAPATTGKADKKRPSTGRSNKPVTRINVPAPAPQPLPEVSGLMYYVELVSPDGQTSRVTTDRVFRSGERILLHVVSSIDGDIAVYQRTSNGHAARLFPDARIANGSGRIVKGVDTVLPSPESWFRFDDQPGIEELTLVLTPRGTPAEPQRAQVTAPATPRYDEIAPVAGSKGLVVETDRNGSQQATYVVRQIEHGRPPEPVVVRVQLEHR